MPGKGLGAAPVLCGRGGGDMRVTGPSRRGPVLWDRGGGDTRAVVGLCGASHAPLSEHSDAQLPKRLRPAETSLPGKLPFRSVSVRPVSHWMRRSPCAATPNSQSACGQQRHQLSVKQKRLHQGCAARQMRLCPSTETPRFQAPAVSRVSNQGVMHSCGHKCTSTAPGGGRPPQAEKRENLQQAHMLCKCHKDRRLDIDVVRQFLGT